jgi:hypothetical protein
MSERYPLHSGSIADESVSASDGLRKPVIARNEDGLVDAVMNGKLGVLLDLDNVAEIAESLMSILKKRHPLGILHGPGRLRAEVIAAYSYPRFVETLAVHLVTFRFFSEDSRG